MVDDTKTIVVRLLNLNEQLSDTRLESGSELYNILAIFMKRRKVAKAVVDDLRARFPCKKGGHTAQE